MIKEFKDFIMKGNVLDMAVGIIIGAAFGTVVKSLVDKVVMPPIGMLLGGIDFSQLQWVIGTKEVEVDGQPVVETVAIQYGAFINDVITLLIVGFAVFLLVKAYNKAKDVLDTEEEEKEEEPEPSAEEKLLTEIRDLLAKGKG